MWALNNAKAGGPLLTPPWRPAPLSPAAAGRRVWRRGPARVPLVAVRASGAGGKDGLGGGEEAESKASSSGEDPPPVMFLMRSNRRWLGGCSGHSDAELFVDPVP